MGIGIDFYDQRLSLHWEVILRGDERFFFVHVAFFRCGYTERCWMLVLDLMMWMVIMRRMGGDKYMYLCSNLWILCLLIGGRGDGWWA
jgi:hypothetical protein